MGYRISISHVHPSFVHRDSYVMIISALLLLWAMCTSMVNPILYSALNEGFRAAVADCCVIKFVFALRKKTTRNVNGDAGDVQPDTEETQRCEVKRESHSEDESLTPLLSQGSHQSASRLRGKARYGGRRRKRHPHQTAAGGNEE